MRKWLMRFTVIIIFIALLKSQQGLIDSVTNFMIDGIVPSTDWALSNFLSTIAIIVGAYLIYRSIASLRFDMLKRRAILYNQNNILKLSSNQNKATSAVTSAKIVEDLELVQSSL